LRTILRSDTENRLSESRTFQSQVRPSHRSSDLAAGILRRNLGESKNVGHIDVAVTIRV
jgi:hypothetical protein